jgi:GDP-L-fucose synthase
MKVLVTGGSGLVGSAVRKLRPDWTYVDSKTHGSLTHEANVETMFRSTGTIDAVVHLAANVGGMFKNMNKRQEMYEDNILMNTLVLREAVRYNVPRVVTMLSTCIFPDDTSDPELVPVMLHMGPPHPSNEGYAYAKRVSEVHGRIIRETTGTHVTSLIPTNVYGPHDTFSLEDGHVVPALIHRAWIAVKEGTALCVKGTGRALRQFIHADDLARIVVWAVEHPVHPPPMIVCCQTKEYSIRQLATMIAGEYGIPVEFVGGPDGQMRKYAKPGPGAFPQPEKELEVGLRETIEWFKNFASQE